MQASRDKIKAKKQASRAAAHTFVPGEKVLRRNIRSQQRKGGKLERDFLGPFTITSLQGKSANLVNAEGGKFTKISLDHLIPVVEEVARIPHRLKMLDSKSSAPPVESTAHLVLSTAPSVPSTAPLVPDTDSPGQGTESLVPGTASPAQSTASLVPGTDFPVQSTASPVPGTESLVPGTDFPVQSTASPVPGTASPVPGTEPPVQESPVPDTESPIPDTESPVPGTAPLVPSTASAQSITCYSDLENIISAVWSGRSDCVLMAKIGPYKIFETDIAHLGPGRELESEVINSYIFTLVRKHNQEHEGKAYMIDTFAMTKIWQGSYQMLKKVW
ncbi:uncharacterized protein LOC134323471 [Trichomycterus rosablanca]|uniref:uncharacterized protein LOC134312529 n=1 Tax=Trichomycterus rosablanca TaxID=2290929 RepID=UPI002F35FB17